MEDTVSKAREKGFVETLMGRKRWLRDINSANFTVRGFAERNAGLLHQLTHLEISSQLNLAPYTGTGVQVFTTSDWKAGDKNSWAQQLKTRAQYGQNDHSRSN